ncbi:MAG TPA: glycoside hydrolase family 31 protein [Ignavibacteriaceae bacterium]|nr:glycoside hydrolase family 31 protein [Ignavibacteriaceae bacterium]
MFVNFKTLLNMNNHILYYLIISVCFCLSIYAQADYHYESAVEEGEGWWGGVVVDGPLMPLGKFEYEHDLYGDIKENQGSPVLISSSGRYVWSDEPFKFEFKNDSLIIISSLGRLQTGQAGSTLRDAYMFVSRNFFPPNGKIPEALLFTMPQYNTWIELTYDQNEKDILSYAQSIKDNGFPAGVIMIDDNWQEDYGTWGFKAEKFQNPAEMVKKLHDLGFKVMLWVCPFVSADSPNYRFLEQENALLTEDNEEKRPAIIRWWNGASALLDFTNPSAEKWFKEQLKSLMQKYGIDGFKFDAGDPNFYTGKILSARNVTPNEHSELFAKIGLEFPLNEFRACWKMGGQPLAQRLRDKRHDWEDLKLLIPGIIAQGLMGYQFTCPDMIGGGEYGSFLNLETIDEELIVRSAQCSALMPMMQFSVAPWRVLNEKNMKICRDMANLHKNMGEEILKIAMESAFSGEPIVRNMEYVFPGKGYSEIKDQFMLGNDILVAPVIEKNTYNREIIFPEGKWMGEDGSVVTGPAKIIVNVPIERLPWYRRK